MALSKIALVTISGFAVAAASVGTVAAFSGDGASSQVASNTQDLREKYKAPTHVQLKPILAPVHGRRGNVPITVFLESYDRNWIGSICRHNPRIRDAILMALYQSPIQLRNQENSLRSLSSHLVMPVNQALGRNLVKSVYVVSGAKAMSKGSVSRLPFNASGCKGIKDLQKATS